MTSPSSSSPPALAGAAASTRRIWMVGPPATGKTTLAQVLQRRTDIPHHELDALHWQPGWKAEDPRVFEDRVREICSRHHWILDGHYPRLMNIVVAQADVVVWLDLPARVHLSRLVRRTMNRCFSGRDLWNGNRETVGMWFGPQSIFLHGMRTMRRRRAFAAGLGEACDRASVELLRINSARGCADFLASFDACPDAAAVGHS